MPGICMEVVLIYPHNTAVGNMFSLVYGKDVKTQPGKLHAHDLISSAIISLK